VVLNCWGEGEGVGKSKIGMGGRGGSPTVTLKNEFLGELKAIFETV
jgi:hypothetical protein